MSLQKTAMSDGLKKSMANTRYKTGVYKQMVADFEASGEEIMELVYEGERSAHTALTICSGLKSACNAADLPGVWAMTARERVFLFRCEPRYEKRESFSLEGGQPEG